MGERLATVGLVVRELRKANKESLEALGHALGVAASNVSRMERGEQQPTEAQLLAVATRYGVEVWEMFLRQTGEFELSEIRLISFCARNPALQGGGGCQAFTPASRAGQE